MRWMTCIIRIEELSGDCAHGALSPLSESEQSIPPTSLVPVDDCLSAYQAGSSILYPCRLTYMKETSLCLPPLSVTSTGYAEFERTGESICWQRTPSQFKAYLYSFPFPMFGKQDDDEFSASYSNSSQHHSTSLLTTGDLGLVVYVLVVGDVVHRVVRFSFLHPLLSPLHHASTRR